MFVIRYILNILLCIFTAKRIRDDYLNIVEDLLYPTNVSTAYGFEPTEGRYPLHRMNCLGFLKSPLRKVTVLEKWSPYEIAAFESSIFLFGKQFHQIQNEVSLELHIVYY